jgi:RNA polymerase sigma-70 factor, ECF subfamily
MAGDELTRLYKMYGAAIYARCRSLLGDDAEAEDATQETFVRAYTHLSRLPPGREALFWMHRVATNYCLSELRQRRRRPTPVAAVPDTAGAPGDAFDQQMSNRDLAGRLIGGAQAKVRPAAWLYHVDGFEQEEVAGILGVSPRTVATYLAIFLTNARKLVRRSGS